MQVKVLVVDDSRFYRNRLCEILAHDPNIRVVDTAENGEEAVAKALSLKPHVITMDIEMPVMDGISAVREIMKKRPTPILMFSSLTAEGAQATLDALDAGAADFLLKSFDGLSRKNIEFAADLCNRIRVLGSRAAFFARRAVGNDYPTLIRPAKRAIAGSEARSLRRKASIADKYRIVVIGASTGGPIAIQSITSALPSSFTIPIVIVQHMPAAFTRPFAHRLDVQSNLIIREAEDGDILMGGVIYVAPGGRQMILVKKAERVVAKIRDSKENELYKPSIDITYKSVSAVYGDRALAIILTGMGSDGREGATLLKNGGSTIWAQNEQTSVVYGMPQAVIDAGLADCVLPITEISLQLAQGV